MNFKVISINFILIIFLYLLSDIIFSNFVFKQSVDHKCYEHINDGKFYRMKKNCFANMRLVASIDSFKVYTDEFGRRYSGKKKSIKDNNIIFLGDSQTFGVGSDWQNTFVGLLEKKFQKYNFFNLAVPSYSPSVYNYTLNEFLRKNNLNINKIFVLIDLTDVGDEANRWEVKNQEPNLKHEKVFYKKRKGFSKFKKENFKGLYLISSKLRSISRNIKKKENKHKIDQKRYQPINGNPTGGFIYTDHEILTGCNKSEKRTNWWKCGDIKKGLKKIEENIISIGDSAEKLKSEFYLIIMPWPDTLNFGQIKFDWEQFAINLCSKSTCDGLINVFPNFEKVKKEDMDWLERLYLKDDIHLTTEGNNILATEIEKVSF